MINAKKYAMQSVQTNYITLIILRILGFAGNVALWKKLDISKNNYTVSASILWNKCIGKVLDPPVLSTVLNLNSNINHIHSQIIIPGSNNNSDMTISVCSFKKRIRNYLLQIQKEGNPIDWEQSNLLHRT